MPEYRIIFVFSLIKSASPAWSQNEPSRKHQSWVENISSQCCQNWSFQKWKIILILWNYFRKMFILKMGKISNTAFSERRWRRQPFDGGPFFLNVWSSTLKIANFTFYRNIIQGKCAFSLYSTFQKWIIQGVTRKVFFFRVCFSRPILNQICSN